MKYMKCFIVLFVGFTLSVNLYGQNDASNRTKINRLFMEANTALDEGDTLSAINKFKEVFTINPNDTNACGRLGKIYGNARSSFFNKKFALNYYNLFLKNSKNERNKEKVRAEIQRLSQYDNTESEQEQSEFVQTETAGKKQNAETTETDRSEVSADDSEFLRDSLKTNTNITQSQPVVDVDSDDSGFLRDRVKTNTNITQSQPVVDVDSDDSEFIRDRVKINTNITQSQPTEGGFIRPSNGEKMETNLPSPQPITPNVSSKNERIIKDTILTYLQPFDILIEDVKSLKETDCPTKDGTKYVSALFNHRTGRDAIVLNFDDKKNVSIHQDCDLMVGIREILRDNIDENKQFKVSSDIMSDSWRVKIDLNLPDSVLKDPLWSKNVYRMVGVYFNQSEKIEPDLIEKTNQITQKGKTLKISYKFLLEPINGILYGKATICAEKTDGCKCVLAYSETNQLFGLANDEYRIKEANIENIQKLNIDAESAQLAYEQYQKFCDFHQQTKNDNKNYTEYVNRINTLTGVNQPEALFTSYLVRQYGLWNINKKIPSTKRVANQCKEKIISLQRFLKKNNW